MHVSERIHFIRRHTGCSPAPTAKLPCRPPAGRIYRPPLEKAAPELRRGVSVGMGSEGWNRRSSDSAGSWRWPWCWDWLTGWRRTTAPGWTPPGWCVPANLRCCGSGWSLADSGCPMKSWTAPSGTCRRITDTDDQVCRSRSDPALAKENERWKRWSVESCVWSIWNSVTFFFHITGLDEWK